jgi:hypothetical protein
VRLVLDRRCGMGRRGRKYVCCDVGIYYVLKVFG